MIVTHNDTNTSDLKPMTELFRCDESDAASRLNRVDVLITDLIVIFIGVTSPPRLVRFSNLAQSIDHCLSLVDGDHTCSHRLHSLDFLGCAGRGG